jgi:hypothetical protein
MKTLLSIVACCVMVVAGSAASAKEHEEHGHGKHEDNHGHHSDHGKHYANGHHKFDDHDREITRSWCAENRDRLPAGFRPDDRLSPEIEARLRVGSVLDVELKSRVVPLPTDLLKRLPPPPVDLHYVALGGHVALLDAAHRLHDLLPLPPLPF